MATLTDWIREYQGVFTLETPPREQRRDVQLYSGNFLIGLATAFEYKVTREAAPMYIMGNPDPRNFTRGRRGIVGTIRDLVPNPDGEYFLEKHKRDALSLTINVDNRQHVIPNMTIDLKEASFVDIARSRPTNEWTIQLICRDIKSYETPATNKQAMKLLLKR